MIPRNKQYEYLFNMLIKEFEPRSNFQFFYKFLKPVRDPLVVAPVFSLMKR